VHVEDSGFRVMWFILSERRSPGHSVNLSNQLAIIFKINSVFCWNESPFLLFLPLINRHFPPTSIILFFVCYRVLLSFDSFTFLVVYFYTSHLVSLLFPFLSHLQIIHT